MSWHQQAPVRLQPCWLWRHMRQLVTPPPLLCVWRRPDDAPHYEGADSDTLFPAGSLEMDDPGHPTDVAGGAKDVQAAVVRPEAKPYMNIKNGRWVPPSKSQAEAMMGQLSQMGPDEGV